MARSIRQSLFAALAGFTLLICLCYTGLAVVIAYVTEDMLVERLLMREAAAIASHAAREGSLPASSGELITLHTSRATLPAAVRAATSPSSMRAEVFAGEAHYHLMVRELPRHGRITILADVRPMLVVSKVVQDVGGVLIFVALALIGLALLLAWLLARRLVRPLQTLALEARQLQPGGVAHFSAGARPDEIGELAGRLEASFNALQAALRREHDFTRDVGHELRTPLTVMNNALALAATRPLDRSDIAQLQAGLDELRATIDVLFALARAEHVGQGSFDLRACIEQSLLRMPGEALTEERLGIDLPERLPVDGNRHLANLLLANCLGNALFHGGPGCRLALAWTDEALTIVNTVDRAHGSQVQGFAHGQNLLARVAGALGWAIAFCPGADSYRVEIAPRLASS